MKSDINSKENKDSDQVVLSRADFEAFLETFSNLQIYSTRATELLQRYQDQSITDSNPRPVVTSSSGTYATAATATSTRRVQAEPQVRSHRRTQLSSLEGNGATEQWDLRRKDTVRITNDVRIGNYYLPNDEKIGPVQYFTNRFVVVSISYFRGNRQYHKLVQREPHNVLLVARHRDANLIPRA